VSGNVGFDTNFGELLVDVPSTFDGAVSGFGDNDKIVLTGIANATSIALSGNDLNLMNSTGTVLQTVTLNVGSEIYNTASFAVVENGGNNQATVTVTGASPAPCFTTGTRIKTLTGEVNVERLAVGDIVHAHFAGTAPVVWIGHRHVNCRRHPKPSSVWPVLVSAHAFGPRMPGRDLLLSPDHSVFVDDVLIPIKHLINGKTILRMKMDEVTYYHIELGEHDVLLAEGMPAESYLENGDRAAFDNAGGLVSLHADFATQRWDAYGCAEMVVTGAKFDAVVARIRARVPKTRRASRELRRVA
jgi:collagen type I/II/III/V/XI/XXIV/XXVII alpha